MIVLTMGIEYKVVSKGGLYEENDPNQYLNWALHDIEWEKILTLLNINLAVLYDASINYWCPEQVEHMYKLIKKLNCELNDALKEDIRKLTEYFEFLVKNNAYIYVF